MNNTKNSVFKIAEIEVIYRNKVNPSDRPKIACSQESYDLLKSVWSDKIEYVEEFYVLFLNRANRVLGVTRISEGGMSGTVVDPKRVFQSALKTNASSIILAHNHPSGQTQPSEADRQITKKIKMAGTFLDITVLDHLIVTPYSYYSFADEGTL